jgi:hypothetical protein
LVELLAVAEPSREREAPPTEFDVRHPKPPTLRTALSVILDQLLDRRLDYSTRRLRATRRRLYHPGEPGCLRVRGLDDVTRCEDMPGNCYRIVVKDELGASYERTFERMRLEAAEGETEIRSSAPGRSSGSRSPA